MICNTQIAMGNTKKNNVVLILVNHDKWLYDLRIELIQVLLKNDYTVHICVPFGDYIEKIKEAGCICHDCNFEGHGTNPFNEYRLFRRYSNLIKDLLPNIILGFTIKPNIYGSLIASNKKTYFIPTITGLGTALYKEGFFSKILMKVYKFSFRNNKAIFFQNTSNLQAFSSICSSECRRILVPGSGVSLSRFPICKFPSNNKIEFYFVSRIMKDKGVDVYLEVAKFYKKKYDNIEFHIVGNCEIEYCDIIKQYDNDGIIINHGAVSDIQKYYNQMHCLIHPSYHEGMSNVCLEAAASGRPVIASDIPGCKEIVDDGTTGYLFKPKDVDSLVEAIEKFVKLSYEEKRQMGISARKKVEAEFDRNIVVDAYLKAINEVTEEEK